MPINYCLNFNHILNTQTRRMLGYSFITHPTYIFPFEALEGLTMVLMMTSAVTYVAKISSSSTVFSVMGLMGALFFGIGKGSGSLFGGLMMSYIAVLVLEVEVDSI